MNTRNKIIFQSMTCLMFALALVVMTPASSMAAGYDNALKDVKGYDAVFEVSLGDPKIANLVFWAVKNAYEVDEVKALPETPNIVIVFHGPVVKLLSSNKAPFNGREWEEVEKFQATLRQMKKDGVKMEVCLYAAKVLGVDEATIMPEVDRVGNGFVSVIGYQMQDYAVVRIP